MWINLLYQARNTKGIIAVLLLGQLAISSHAQGDLLPAYPNEIHYNRGSAYFGNAPFTGILVEEGTNTRLGEYRSGKRVGLHTAYHSPGVKKEEGHYDNGLRTGSHWQWYQNGQRKVEYTYFNDRIVDGRYTVLDAEGQRTVVEIYANGQKVGEATYKGDVLYEPVVRYNPQGSKQVEGLLKNSEPEGTWTEWYADGKKAKEEEYVNGVLHGTVTTYWPAGEKKRVERFVNDRSVEVIYNNNVDPTTSVGHAMRSGGTLFMAVYGALADTLFVVVDMVQPSGSGSSVSQDFREQAFGAVENRMIRLEGSRSNPYLDRRIGYRIEFSEPRCETQYDNGHKVTTGKLGTIETQVPAGYRGKASLRMKVMDLAYNTTLYNGALSATSGIYPERSAALSSAPSLIRSEVINIAYAAFRIKANVASIGDRDRQGFAKRISLDRGSELSMAKGFAFNIHLKDDKVGPPIGTVQVMESSEGSSSCKVTSGEERITQLLDAGTPLIAISAYKL